jgi:hypothetical protein
LHQAVGPRSVRLRRSMQPLAEPWRLVAKPSCGRASSSRLTPAAIRPNERRERAFRAAANAVSAATVTPGASPRAFSAAFSRSSASLSLRGLLSAMRQSIRPGQFQSQFWPPKRPRKSNSGRPAQLSVGCALKAHFPWTSTAPVRAFKCKRGEADGSRPASRGTGHSTAPLARECESFLDNFVAGLGVCSQIGGVDPAAGGVGILPSHGEAPKINQRSSYSLKWQESVCSSPTMPAAADDNRLRRALAAPAHRRSNS